MFHDFLDHLDGIVAKIQRQTYPNHDDPILGGFLDAFCDKIVSVISILTIIQKVSFDKSSGLEVAAFILLSYAVVAYESLIGIIRVQDFFLAIFERFLILNIINLIKITFFKFEKSTVFLNTA